MTSAKNPFGTLPRREFLRALGAAGLPVLAPGPGPAAPGPELPDMDTDMDTDAEPAPRSGDVVEVGRPLVDQPLLADLQRCSLPTKYARLGAPGTQLRVIHETAGPGLYTVGELRHEGNPDLVRMSLAARQRFGTSELFNATLSGAVTAALSDAEAQAQGEFVERLVDDGHSAGLVVLAPHGGAIEAKTDAQAEHLNAALADLGVSSWICKGWRRGGGAFERWHIRSTDLSPCSFPGLGAIASRGFAHALSFHGMDSGGVLIGGAGPLALKQQLAAAISAALRGTTIEVAVASSA
jgi:phage replication-related protein YjqB (UPF0714/DUF867 family)